MGTLLMKLLHPISYIMNWLGGFIRTLISTEIRKYSPSKQENQTIE